MLLTLLAFVSSTTLLVGAISAMREQGAGSQGIVAIALALILAVTNFFGVRRAGLGLANFAREKPDAVQTRYGKTFCLIILLWAACAEFIGFWTVRLVRSF